MNIPTGNNGFIITNRYRFTLINTDYEIKLKQYKQLLSNYINMYYNTLLIIY